MKLTINRYDKDKAQVGWLLNGQFIEWSYSSNVDDAFILLYGDRDRTGKTKWFYHISSHEYEYNSGKPYFTNSKTACVDAAKMLFTLRQEKLIKLPLKEAKKCLSDALKLPMVYLKFRKGK